MGDGCLSLVARLLATAALWVRIPCRQISKLQFGRHKQRSDQRTLQAAKKNTQNKIIFCAFQSKSILKVSKYTFSQMFSLRVGHHFHIQHTGPMQLLVYTLCGVEEIHLMYCNTVCAKSAVRYHRLCIVLNCTVRPFLKPASFCTSKVSNLRRF